MYLYMYEKGNYYERDKTGKRFITAFQLFKLLKITLIG